MFKNQSPRFAIAGVASLMLALAPSLMKVSPAFAQLRDEYTLEQAQSGTVSIQVWPGSGTNLDFTGTGQYIYRAWLDDPSRVQFDTDTPIENANAQIIHLRKIDGIDFEGLPATGVTLLSVATVDGAGQRHLYQFQVSYAAERPDYSTVALLPARVPVAVSTIPANSSYGGVDLETFRAGVAQLILNGTIEGDGPMHERLKIFISLVQNGSSPTEAAQSAGISLEVVQEVAAIGLSAAAEEARARFTDTEETPDEAVLENDAETSAAAADEASALPEAKSATETDSEALIETLQQMSTFGGE